MKLMAPITLLIVATVLALGAVLVTQNAVKNKVTPLPTASTPASSTLEKVQADLNLKPEFSSVKVGDEISFTVTIDSHYLGVSGIQSEFNYDPKVLSIEAIEPGPFLNQPVVITKTIDPAQGKISYALISLKYSTGVGPLFTIKARATAKNTGLNNPLFFSKNETKVGLASITKDKRYSETETVIIFAENTVNILQ